MTAPINEKKSPALASIRGINENGTDHTNAAQGRQGEGAGSVEICRKCGLIALVREHSVPAPSFHKAGFRKEKSPLDVLYSAWRKANSDQRKAFLVFVGKGGDQ